MKICDKKIPESISTVLIRGKNLRLKLNL